MPENQDPFFLENLCDLYCRRLEKFIRVRVADEMAVDDVLQEVFIRIHTSLCCLRQPERVESWIYQVTRNVIIDQYRRNKHEPLPLADHLDLAVEADFYEEDPEAQIASSLYETVLELPPLYRQALLLTEYQGLSQVEMAEKLGISLSGAKSRVQRARQKLKDLLLACCHFELDRRGTIIAYQERCCCCEQEL